MELNYKFYLKNIFEYQKFNLKNDRLIQRSIKIRSRICFLIFLLLFLLFFFSRAEGEEIAMVFTVVLALASLIFIPPYLMWMYHRDILRHLIKNCSHLENQVINVEAREENLKISNPGIISEINYSEFDKIIEIDHYYILHLKSNSAVVLPKDQIEQSLLQNFISKFEEFSGLVRVKENF